MKCPYCNQDSLYLVEGVIQTHQVVDLQEDGGLIINDLISEYPDNYGQPYVRCENNECKRFLDDIDLHFAYIEYE